MIELRVRRETWPLRHPFVIARTTMRQAVTLEAEVRHGSVCGRGESEPHESNPQICDAVELQMRSAAGHLSADISIDELRQLLPLPTARNAVDCALWDLRAKQSGVPVWRLAGLQQPQPMVTAVTIGISTPDLMGRRARELHACPLIKVKLGGGDDMACVEAVRRGAPQARLTVDANEAWTFAQLREFMPHLVRQDVALIEQPLPALQDDELAGFSPPVPICADEACDDLSSLARVKSRYQYINIKLDKAGGFTEALLLARAAHELGLGVMTGCNVGTSLAMAPALLIGQLSSFVDIDGAAMLSRDRDNGLIYDLGRGCVQPSEALLWG